MSLSHLMEYICCSPCPIPHLASLPDSHPGKALLNGFWEIKLYVNSLAERPYYFKLCSDGLNI